MKSILATTLIGTVFAVRLQNAPMNGECKAVFKKDAGDCEGKGFTQVSCLSPKCVWEIRHTGSTEEEHTHDEGAKCPPPI